MHSMYVSVLVFIWVWAPGYNYSSLCMPFGAGVTTVSSVPSGLSVTSFPKQGYSPLSHPGDGSTQVHSSHIWDIAVMDMSTRGDSPTEAAVSWFCWAMLKPRVSAVLRWLCSTFPWFSLPSERYHSFVVLWFRCVSIHCVIFIGCPEFSHVRDHVIHWDSMSAGSRTAQYSC